MLGHTSSQDTLGNYNVIASSHDFDQPCLCGH